jgi:predicted metal-dependent hydrolase
MIVVGDIQVTVTYKKVKRVTLKVINDKVVIVSPRGVSKDYLTSFVEKNVEWIKQTLAKKNEGPFLSKNFVDGDKITVLGVPYTLKCVQSVKNEVLINGEEIKLCYTEKNAERKAKIFRKWQEITLLRILDNSLKKWNALTDLDCSGVTIKDMKSRWGSCNILTKKIAFSVRLLTQKIECIDYVVLHELTHVIHKNHDRNFYSYIAKFMPSYKRISKELKMPIEK